MSKGILGLVGLAVTLAFAIPIALYGLSMLGRGQPLMGSVALGIAGLMIVLQEYLTTPGDLPGKAVEKAAGAVLMEPGENEEKQ